MVRGERWQVVKSLLNESLELSAEERQAFLDERLEPGSELRQHVESFFTAEDEAGAFLETPAFCLHEEIPDESGRMLGPYRLLRELGRGGMGAVYLAERADGTFEQHVAVKLLKRGLDTDEIVRRFEAERRILADLVHPNVARLLDGGTSDDGRPYFVMELVDGEPITSWCSARHLSPRQRVALFRQICSTVHYAHQRLVVHRDLKPANILVKADGTPMLLDFGIAKLLDPSSHEPLTTTSSNGSPMTPHYASPEQFKGEAITTATDVYGLGVLLYEVLSGCRPYPVNGHPSEELARAVCEDTPPRPSVAARGSETEDAKAIGQRLKGDLDNIVLKAMRKEPSARYVSAEQLGEDLDRYLDGRPVLARRPTFWYRAKKFTRRYPWQIATVVMTVFATLLQLQNLSLRQEFRALSTTVIDDVMSREPLEDGPITPAEALDRAEQLSQASIGDPETQASLWDALGGIYLDQGMYDRSRSYFEKSLSTRRKIFGDSHPLVAASLLNIANLERSVGADKAAEAQMRTALHTLRQVYPNGHQDLARGLNNLASLLGTLGEREEAETLSRESLEMTRRLLGQNHPDVSNRLNTLAKIVRDNGDLSTAVKLYEECLEIRLLHEEPTSRRVVNVINNLAGVYEEMTRNADALPLREAVLAARRDLFPGDHASVVTALNNLALLLTDEGRTAKARELAEEALAMQERLTGKENPRTAAIQRTLAVVNERSGLYDECEELALAAIPFATGKTLTQLEGVLGGCLLGLGQRKEATKRLAASHAHLDKVAPLSRWTRWIADWLEAAQRPSP